MLDNSSPKQQHRLANEVANMLRRRLVESSVLGLDFLPPQCSVGASLRTGAVPS